ncbi:MAG: DMT family transporter [bacterium]
MPQKSFIAVALSMILFGAWGVAAKFINIPVPLLIFIMTGTAAIVLLPFSINNIKDLFRDSHAFLVSLNLALDLILLTEAYRRVDLAIVVSIHYIGPVLVVLIAPWILKEHFKWKFLIFILIALIGGWLVSVPTSVEKINTTGLLLAFGSAVTLAGNIILQRRYMRRDNADPVTAVFRYNVFLAGFMVIPAMFSIFKYQDVKIAYIWEAGITGILIQGVAMLLFNYAAKSLTAKILGIISYTEIFWASVFGLVIFSQSLTLFQVLGMILIIAASIYSNLSLEKSNA